ncbi:MAG: hypothetical protein ACI4ND_01605 [Succinivibrio sp.]
MSIIQEIQNRALDEGRIKAESVNSYKVLSVRPSAELSSLIEVLAFLDGKSPSEFIASNFSKALCEFIKLSDKHIPAVCDAIAQCMESDNGQHVFRKNSAVDTLISDGVVRIEGNECDKKTAGTSRLLKHGFNEKLRISRL